MAHPSSRGRPRPLQRSHRPRGLILRTAASVLIAVATIGVGVWLLLPDPEPSLAADRRMTVTMAGYQPRQLTVPAGQPTTVLLRNPDTPYHTDGGGMHQFAIPELSVDVRISPQSSVVFGLPALPAGTYTFYCDVCCGGKENPSMQGTLVVS